MSAVAFAARPQPEPHASQPHLFAVEGGAVAQGPAAEPVATLAGALSQRWSALGAGGQAGCLVCGAAMEPRWSAGHGIVGGRCRSCGTSLG